MSLSLRKLTIYQIVLGWYFKFNIVHQSLSWTLFSESYSKPKNFPSLIYPSRIAVEINFIRILIAICRTTRSYVSIGKTPSNWTFFFLSSCYLPEFQSIPSRAIRISMVYDLPPAKTQPQHVFSFCLFYDKLAIIVSSFNVIFLYNI